MARPCRHTGCPNLVISRSQKGFCDTHANERTNWYQHAQGRTSSERGYGYNWRKLRERVLERDKYLCQCDDCKASGCIRPANDVDHIVPKAKGGTDNMTNLQAINSECHRNKTSKVDSKL